MSKIIGLIAEDNSDIEVVKEIFRKYLNDNEFKVKKFIGNGCGKLKNKCGSWAKNLFSSGCSHVFVFHDLDKQTEKKLRKILESKLCPRQHPNSLIVIPTEELEAWLLSDSVAIKEALNLKKSPKHISNCEAINSPKEFLRDLIYRSDKIRYLNTVHNKKIAKEARLEELRRCKSFISFDQFVVKHICA